MGNRFWSIWHVNLASHYLGEARGVVGRDLAGHDSCMVCGSIQCQMRVPGFRQRCLELATHLIIDAYQLNRDSLMPIHPLGD